MIDLLHTNAILKSFVEILISDQKSRISAAITISGTSSIDGEKTSRRRSRIRWFLAYTLINNEELRLKRAHAKRIIEHREEREAKEREKEEKARKRRIHFEKLLARFWDRIKCKSFNPCRVQASTR